MSKCELYRLYQRMNRLATKGLDGFKHRAVEKTGLDICSRQRLREDEEWNSTAKS